MNTTRLVSLVAATIITVAESLIFLWVLAPTRVEAAPAARMTAGEALPTIVITAHRDQVTAGGHVHH